MITKIITIFESYTVYLLIQFFRVLWGFFQPYKNVFEN